MGAGGMNAGLRESQHLDSRGFLRFRILVEDIKLLLEHIRKICGKISFIRVNLSHPRAEKDIAAC